MSRAFRLILGAALALALATVAIVSLGWLARGLWLAPLARTALATWVDPLLGGTTTLGELEVGLDGGRAGPLVLRATADDAVLGDLEIAELAWRWRPARLASDPAMAVTTARLRVDRLRIRVPAATTAPAATGDGFDPAELAAVLRDGLAAHLAALPDGARVDVGRLEVSRAGRSLFDGPITAVWSAAPRRELAVLGEGLDVTVHASTTALRVRLRSADPARFAAPFDLDLPVRGGALAGWIDADLAALRADAEVTWSGVALTDHGRGELHARARWVPGLAIADIEAEAGGVNLSIAALEVPLEPFRPRAIRGAATLVADDLEPWWDVLPDAVVAWRPRRARLAIQADDEEFTVGAGSIVADDATVAIERGRFPRAALLDAVTVRGAPPEAGRLELVATIGAPRTIALGPDLELVAQGEVRATLSGTQESAVVEGRLAAGPGSIAGHAWQSIGATVRWSGAQLEVQELAVTGLAREGAGEIGLAVTGEGSARFGDTTEVRFAVGIDGPLDPLLGERLASTPFADAGEVAATAEGTVAFGATPLPVGAVRVDGLRVGGATDALRAAARIDPVRDGTQRFRVELRGDLPAELLTRLAAAHAPFVARPQLGAIELTADGSYDGTSLPDAELRLSARGVRIGDLAESAVRVRARLADATVLVDELRVDGALRMVGEGRLPLGMRAAGLDLRFDAAIPAAAIAAVAPDLAFHPDVQLGVRAAGSLADPRLDARAAVELDAAVLTARWPTALGAPPAGAVDLRAAVSLRPGEPIGVDVQVRTATDRSGASLGLALAGRAPLRIVDGGLVAADDAAATVAGLATSTLRPRNLAPIATRASIAWDARGFRVDALEIDGDRWSARGSGSLALPATALIDGALAAAVVDARVDVDALRLGALPPDWTGLALLDGELRAGLRVGGTLLAPSLDGSISVSDGRAKLAPPIPVLDAVALELRLDDRALRLERARATLGVGSVTLDATLSAAGDTPVWRDWQQATLDVRLVADSALVMRTTGRKLRTDAAVTVDGSYAAGFEVRGRVALDSGKIIERISLVPDFGKRGGTGLSTGIELPSIPAPLGPKLRYDVELDSVEPLEIAANVVELPLDIAARLRGTGDRPFLEGAVSAQRGVVRLPALTLDVERVVVTFRPEDPAHPRVEASAVGRRHGIDVEVRATGPLDRVELLVSSSPPLTQQELYVLISTGVMPDTLRQQGLEGRATLVGGYLAQEIVDFYFGSDSTERGPSLVDRIHFFSGREISRNGVESLTVDFDLQRDETWVLRGERDIYEDYNMGIVWRLKW